MVWIHGGGMVLGRWAYASWAVRCGVPAHEDCNIRFWTLNPA